MLLPTKAEKNRREELASLFYFLSRNMPIKLANLLSEQIQGGIIKFPNLFSKTTLRVTERISGPRAAKIAESLSKRAEKY